MTIEKVSRMNSQRRIVLIYMDKYKKYWHTPRSVSSNLNAMITMTEQSLGRRMREDAVIGLLTKRNKFGYTEFKWAGK